MRADLPLILLGGLLGSSHCIGMCGGFALSIGMGSTNIFKNLVRQLSYSSGRIFTYAVLGSFAGFAGLWLTRRSTSLIHAQAVLSLIAGIFLVVQGLKSLGISLSLRSRSRSAMNALPPCLSGSILGPFLRSPRPWLLFIGGVLNGLLPCGLVYGYLALASSDANILVGLTTMVAFGIGTVPLMVLTGLGASILSTVARKRLFQVAGVCVLLTGLVAINRGIFFWCSGETSQCPGCVSKKP